MSQQESPPGSPAQAGSPASIKSAEVPPIDPDAITAAASTQPHRNIPRNLVDCTEEQFRNYDFKYENRHEVIDGFLVSKEMGDKEESQILRSLGRLVDLLPSSYDVEAHTQMEVELNVGSQQPDQAASSNDAAAETAEIASPKAPSAHNQADSDDQSGKSTISGGSAKKKRPTIVFPDLQIVRKSEGSEASDFEDTPYTVGRTPIQRDALLLLEVTSGNYKNDMKRKVHIYEKYGIPEYVVLDRQKRIVEKNRKPQVIVFKLGEDKKYVRHVFANDEKVDVSYFNYWGLTARQFLDYRYTRSLANEVSEKQKKSEKKAEEEARQRRLSDTKAEEEAKKRKISDAKAEEEARQRRLSNAKASAAEAKAQRLEEELKKLRKRSHKEAIREETPPSSPEKKPKRE